MNQFYDNQEENMRNKLTEHEFGMIPGAWEDMEKRLDKLEGAAVSGGSMGTWVLVSALVVATTAAMLYYQLLMPYGKNNSELVIGTTEETTQHQLAIQNETKNALVDIKDKNDVENIAEVQANLIPSDDANTDDLNQNVKLRPTTLNKTLRPTERPELPEALIKAEIGSNQTAAKNTEVDEHKAIVVEKTSKTPVYTRKVEFIHTFSESHLKWRNENSNKENSTQKCLITIGKDTPIIVLKTPYNTAPKSLQFGLSAAVNTKIYNKERFSVAPVVGAFVRKRIASKYALQADLQYKLLLNHGAKAGSAPRSMDMMLDVDPSEEVQYENRAAKVYEFRRMHLIEMPLSFIYRLNRKHNVSLGVNTAYLFAVKTNKKEINAMSTEELGFSSIDLGALAGYEYNINDRFSIALSYNVGFLNLARNTFNRSLSMNESSQPYQFNGNHVEEECLMPIEMSTDEPIFFEAPTQFYNTDLKIMLRYIF
jgi:hypothetical protein